ncbi:keratin, type II cytoskeletal I-like isoform X3 [Myxocyprinus asiaticus]|uniref:keratin, type II cytoskeletal I-like isoform X3 n=1 Tax=Myxocyprinus asiaticus TaxID=70543 RepID=UPI002221DFCB|nr:keratin, type II cytoskeletal I-like isoform X3 [Myxocyprinus asiaticus]
MGWASWASGAAFRPTGIRGPLKQEYGTLGYGANLRTGLGASLGDTGLGLGTGFGLGNGLGAALGYQGGKLGGRGYTSIGYGAQLGYSAGGYPGTGCGLGDGGHRGLELIINTGLGTPAKSRKYAAGVVLGAARSLPYSGQPVVSDGLGPQGKTSSYGGTTYGGKPTLGPDTGLGSCSAYVCYSNATCKSQFSGFPDALPEDLT